MYNAQLALQNKLWGFYVLVTGSLFWCLNLCSMRYWRSLVLIKIH